MPDVEPTVTETVTENAITTDAPKPTETVEFWKQKSREQEARAKANADAAQELATIRESQKSESEKQADATARAVKDAADARAEALAYKVAAAHGVTPDNFDLLGTGTEEAITARAERIGGLLKIQAENERLKAELEALRAGKPSPTSSRPVADLKPGATPQNTVTEDDALYNSLFGSPTS